MSLLEGETAPHYFVLETIFMRYLVSPNRRSCVKGRMFHDLEEAQDYGEFVFQGAYTIQEVC